MRRASMWQQKEQKERTEAQQAQQRAQQEGQSAQQEASQAQQRASQAQQSQAQQSQQGASASEQTVAGRVAQVSASELTLDQATPSRLKINDSTQITVDGQPGSVSQIPQGSEVRAAYRMDGGEATAIRVEAKSR